MKNLYQRAEFLTSVNHLPQLPEDIGIEVAFAGRSNAGKSSALNAITQNKRLARTSKTPGRTQMINLFTIDDDRRLVDLPGYGYAKVSHTTKRHWQEVLAKYLASRTCLRGLFLVVDIRHPLQALDEQMMHWAATADLLIHVLLTKADKLKRGPALDAWQRYKKQIKKFGPHVTSQVFSAESKLGVEEARRVLDDWYEF